MATDWSSSLTRRPRKLQRVLREERSERSRKRGGGKLGNGVDGKCIQPDSRAVVRSSEAGGCKRSHTKREVVAAVGLLPVAWMERSVHLAVSLEQCMWRRGVGLCDSQRIVCGAPPGEILTNDNCKQYSDVFIWVCIQKN